MRRQTGPDALRIASGVIFTVAGVVKENPNLRNESLLLEVAGEIHNIGRRLMGEAQDDPEWEQHLKEEEEEAQQAVMALEADGQRPPTPNSPASHWRGQVQRGRRRAQPDRDVSNASELKLGNRTGGDVEEESDVLEEAP